MYGSLSSAQGCLLADRSRPLEMAVECHIIDGIPEVKEESSIHIDYIFFAGTARHRDGETKIHVLNTFSAFQAIGSNL
jgi:hypothetical protein